eukprot:900678_1
MAFSTVCWFIVILLIYISKSQTIPNATILDLDEDFDTFVYIKFDSPTTISVAQQWCFDALGTSLATITSQTQTRNVGVMMQSYWVAHHTSANTTGGIFGAFLDCYRWHWLDNTTTWGGYTHYVIAPPNVPHGCVEMSWNGYYSSETGGWYWSYHDCTPSIYYICNKGKPPTPAPTSTPYPTIVFPFINSAAPTTSPITCLPTQSPSLSQSSEPTATPTLYPTLTPTRNPVSCMYPPDFEDKPGEWINDDFGDEYCCDEPLFSLRMCYFYPGCADTYNDFCNDNPACVGCLDTSTFVPYEFYICNALYQDQLDILQDGLSDKGQKWVRGMLVCLQEHTINELKLQFKETNSLHYTCTGIDDFVYNLHEQCYLGTFYNFASWVNQSYVSLCELSGGSDWDLLFDAFSFIDGFVGWRTNKQFLNSVRKCIERGYEYVGNKTIYHIRVTYKIPDWNTIYSSYQRTPSSEYKMSFYTLLGGDVSIMEVANTLSSRSFGELEHKTHAIDVTNDTNGTVDVEFIVVTHNESDVQYVFDAYCDLRCVYNRFYTQYLFDNKQYMDYCIEDVKLLSPWLNQTNLTYCPTPMPTMKPTEESHSTDQSVRSQMSFGCNLCLIFLFMRRLLYT